MDKIMILDVVLLFLRSDISLLLLFYSIIYNSVEFKQTPLTVHVSAITYICTHMKQRYQEGPERKKTENNKVYII